MNNPEAPETVAALKAKADLAINRMAAELKALGVTATVAAIILPPWVAIENRVAASLNGTGEEVINMVGALAMQMMPEDFAELFHEMHTNPLFLRILEVNRAQQQPAKPHMVN